jgi:hypothetical protein
MCLLFCHIPVDMPGASLALYTVLFVFLAISEGATCVHPLPLQGYIQATHVDALTKSHPRGVKKLAPRPEAGGRGCA